MDRVTDDPYRWVVLALVTLAHGGVILVGMSFVPLAPYLQGEFQVTRAEIGLLISSLYIGGVITSVPSGSLTDRLGPRIVILYSTLIVGLLCLVVARAPAYAWLPFILLLTGLGYGGINPPGTAAVMVWFVGRLRGTALGIKQTGYTIGGGFGALLLPRLAEQWGWRSALSAVSLGLIGFGLLVFVLFRSSPRGAKVAAIRRSPGDVLKWMLLDPDLRHLSVIAGILSAAQVVVVSYLLLFLVEVVGMSPVAAGGILALMNLAGVAGRVAWGALSDRFLVGGRRFVLAGVTLLSSIGIVLLALTGPDAPGWLPPLLAILLGVTAVGWNGVFMALAGEMTGSLGVGGAFGVITAVQFIGIIMAPPLFGLMVDHTGSYALAWLVVAVINLANGFSILGLKEPGVS